VAAVESHLPTAPRPLSAGRTKLAWEKEYTGNQARQGYPYVSRCINTSTMRTAALPSHSSGM